MKAVLGLVSLLIVLAVVGWNAKNALKAASSAAPAAATTNAGGSTENATPASRQQVQGFEQDLKKALGEAAAARASEAN